jgi:hypothetical protein
MSLHAWRSWPRRSFNATPRGGRHPDPRRRTRPTLEALEDRLAPASFTALNSNVCTLVAGLRSRAIGIWPFVSCFRATLPRSST